jgi:hypothetical protein
VDRHVIANMGAELAPRRASSRPTTRCAARLPRAARASGAAAPIRSPPTSTPTRSTSRPSAAHRVPESRQRPSCARLQGDVYQVVIVTGQRASDFAVPALMVRSADLSSSPDVNPTSRQTLEALTSEAGSSTWSRRPAPQAGCNGHRDGAEGASLRTFPTSLGARGRRRRGLPSSP